MNSRIRFVALAPWFFGVSLEPLVAVALPSSVGEDEGARVEVHGVIDTRFTVAGKHTAWLDGGFGRTRYGGSDRDRDGLADRAAAGFHASQLSLVVDAQARDDLGGHLHLNAGADNGRFLGKVGVVEAFAVWRKTFGGGGPRLRLRSGIFNPPFSLEHPETAWSTRYTVTPSALGSWLGEEVKSTGLEATLVWSPGAPGEVELQGALFAGDDGAGALLAWRGFALHDRQGQTDDELPLPPILSLTDPRFFPDQGLRTEPFREIDGRPGFYVQARTRIGTDVMLQAAWFDNRGDIRAAQPGNPTWNTRFGVVGGELKVGRLTVLGQFLGGRARMGSGPPALVDAPFRTGYVLASWACGSCRLSARFDRFKVDDDDSWREGKDLNEDHGCAATLAWTHEVGRAGRIQVEYLFVHVKHPFASTAGEAEEFDQSQFQAGWRFAF